MYTHSFQKQVTETKKKEVHQYKVRYKVYKYLQYLRALIAKFQSQRVVS